MALLQIGTTAVTGSGRTRANPRRFCGIISTCVASRNAPSGG